MGLFGFGKKDKKEQNESCCCCGGDCGAAVNTVDVSGKIKSIKVLGAGCKSCHEQYENVKKAVSELGISIEVEYITNMEKIMEYGAMSMPAIVVNGQVVSTGKVLKAADVVKLLNNIK